MILNTQMNSPQSSGAMDSQQCETFFLKRKLGPDDQIDNGGPGFVQAKKRHLQEFSASNNNFQGTEESQQEQNQICNDINFTLNTNSFINDLFNYENNLVPVQTNFPNEQYDNNWQNADLLELDHRYNSGITVINQDVQQNGGTNMNNNNQVSFNEHQQNQNVQRKEITVFNTQKQNSSSEMTPLRMSSGETLINSHRNGPINTEHETDFEDKNLSWLFNFKLDELPHLSPEVNQIQTVQPQKTNLEPSKTQSKNQNKAGKKFEELVMEVTSELDANEMIVGENIVVENTPRMPKKPPFTYTELIEYALEDKGELTVSGIYQWISDRFPFYKSNDDRWKNSVRHNLSINPHFRKGVKAPQGAGHLWTISSGDSEENILAWEHKKQRLDLFFKMESLQKERIPPSPTNHDQSQPMFDEAAIAVATITHEMQTSMSSDHSSSCSPSTCDRMGTSVSTTHELPFNDLISDEDLRKTAGQILNGIHREVEVQAVNSIISTYHDTLLDSEDYLNPIQKDVSVHESGFYVTEIDPCELGIQMSQVEDEVLFNDEFNLNYFSYNAGTDIVA